MKRMPLKVEALKTFGGTVLGAIMLLAGWSIFSNNGYDSALVFFIGLILLPIGLYTLANSVTGGYGENPWSILAGYRERLNRKKKISEA